MMGERDGEEGKVGVNMMKRVVQQKNKNNNQQRYKYERTYKARNNNNNVTLDFCIPTKINGLDL